MLAKVVLWLLGLAFLAFGFWALFAPATMVPIIHYELTSPAAVTEFRAFYGGLEIGLGIFLILAAVKPALTHAGLMVGALTMACVGISRFLGIIMDQSGGTPFIYIALILEGVSCMLAGYALTKTP